MASKKAGRTKDKCKRWLDSGTRQKNAKRKMLKRIKRMTEESKAKIISNTKIGRKKEKGIK